jgi:hypothetical protein
MQELALLTLSRAADIVRILFALPGEVLLLHPATFVRAVISVLASALLFFVLVIVVAAQDMDAKVTGCPTASGNNVCLVTFQGGISRRGFNPNEGTLTQAAITATTGSTFHQQYSVAVKGAVYGQPLVLPNVVYNGTTYADVVYVVTEQDYVYAINGSNGKILWSDNLVPSGYTYLTSTVDLNGCTTILPSPGYVGITSTPVIDVSQNTGTNNTITSGILYTVARTKTTTSPVTYVQTLYAISVTDGTVKASKQIGGTYTSGSVSISFDSDYAHTQNQRGALLAVPVTGQNPQIFITWAAHCDAANFPYNGWLMSYQLNASLNALTQTSIWMSVPSDTSYEGGIWEGGSGPAADGGGHIYFSIANGDANVNTSTPPNDNPTSCATSPCDYGNSILRMQLSGSPATLAVQDFFTVFDWKSRNNKDYDLGSGGVMLLPFQSSGNPQNLLAQAGKEGSIYLLRTDKGHMGGYNGGGADQVTQYIASALCYQTVPVTECGIWGAPAWWTTGSGGAGSSGYAYWGGKNLGLMQFKFYPNGSSCTGTTGAGFCTTPTATTTHTFGWPGPTPTVSAPSNSSTKAIVWLIDAGNASSGGKANLWAFDGATLNCLFSTDSKATSCTRTSSADVPAGIAVKFTVPSVANGKVYVGTAGGSSTSGGYLNIYGLSD